MVGLPIDDDIGGGNSSNSLATIAAKVELQAQIAALQEQLRAATSALHQLNDDGSNEDESADHSITSLHHHHPWHSNHPSLPPASLPIPASKRGYLFKWLDRTIGWSGTKWALRFVSLNAAQGQLSYYGTHVETQPRYVLSLRGCAVRDDGWKRNQRQARRRRDAEDHPPLEEPGAYFFLFSIYQRPLDEPVHASTAILSDVDVVPLLRFSTPSLAEKMQWIQLISEACAYCETEQFLIEEAERVAEMEQQQRQQRLMTSAMPESKEGTLPPLYFAPHLQQTKSSHKRRPSFTKTPSAAQFRSKTQNENAEVVERSHSRSGYPPSKPMHRAAAPSYLSVEAPVQNYRGFFNLGVLILIVSNVRLLMSSVKSHGFVLHAFIHLMRDLPHIQQDPWEEFPFISGFALQVLFVLMAFLVEWLLSRQRIPARLGIFLHHINAHASLLFPLWIVWNFIEKPAVGAVLLFHATITWMKLISYILANEDYRMNQKDTEHMLAIVEDLDPSEVDIRYPDNITIGNLFYFWLCPSLTYQIAFPKTPHRRWWKIGGILMRLVICISLFTFVAAQVVSPVLASLVQDLEASGGAYTIGMMADYWLKLAIANTYLWLLLFYGYFHLYLNLFGELLRFGDRVFYRDWWNVLDVGAYWRLWNLPVHFWLVRHLYFPSLRHMNKTAATFLVFLASAIVHEVLVSVPFHMIRPWSFLGMMMQIPLVAMTKLAARKSPTISNMMFWISFCFVGQPMAALLYTVDYQYAKQHAQLMSLQGDQCSAGWEGGICSTK